MNPRPPPGQLSLGHFGIFKRSGTEEDCPLLRVARTWINPDVEAGMREQEAQAQQQAALQAEQASAVKRPVGRPRMDPASKPPLPPKRPVGRPRMDPASKPPLPPKRSVGRPRASVILQAPPAEQEEQAVLRIVPISHRPGAQVWMCSSFLFSFCECNSGSSSSSSSKAARVGMPRGEGWLLWGFSCVGTQGCSPSQQSWSEQKAANDKMLDSDWIAVKTDAKQQRSQFLNCWGSSQPLKLAKWIDKIIINCWEGLAKFRGAKKRG